MSLCSRVQELQLWKPVYPKAGALLQKPLQWETHTPQLEYPLLTATRESRHAATKTHHSQKINKSFKKDKGFKVRCSFFSANFLSALHHAKIPASSCCTLTLRFGVCPHRLYLIAEDTGSARLCHFLRIPSLCRPGCGIQLA